MKDRGQYIALNMNMLENGKKISGTGLASILKAQQLLKECGKMMNYSLNSIKFNNGITLVSRT